MMATDRAFAAAQRQYDAAEPPPDTRECAVCERQRDRGREVEGRFVCEGCLEDDGRCVGCGQLLEDADGGGERCRYCEGEETDEMTDEEKAFPTLPSEAHAEAIALVEQFKATIAKAADEAITTLYTDVMPHIESDSWSNYRRQLLEGIGGYRHSLANAEHDLAKVREDILRQHRAEIVADLNQDNLRRIEELEQQNAELQRNLNRALFGHD